MAVISYGSLEFVQIYLSYYIIGKSINVVIFNGWIDVMTTLSDSLVMSSPQLKKKFEFYMLANTKKALTTYSLQI